MSDAEATPDWASASVHRASPRLTGRKTPLTRSLFVSNATRTYELYAWDRATGGRRQVTGRPNGTTDGVLSADGAWIWWFIGKDVDEFGVWRRQPFAGGEDELAALGLDLTVAQLLLSLIGLRSGDLNATSWDIQRLTDVALTGHGGTCAGYIAWATIQVREAKRETVRNPGSLMRI